MNKQVSHIPSGYKPSPLGIIPEDWEVKRLGEVGEVFSGGTPNTEIQEYWNGNIDWCTPTDITLLNGAVYIERTALKITDLGLKSSSAVLLPPNSIIVCTRATIGNAAISLHQIATNQGFKNIVPNENIDTLFLYYTIVNNKIRLIRLGNGSTFLEVSKSDFENLTIPVPPLPEQHRIVSVLSLWDTAIAKQTALIEKLTLRKRGLMQQLLTGKKRLKGFEGGWKRIKAGEIFKSISVKGNGSEVLLSATQEHGVIPRDQLEGRVTMPTGDTNSFKLVEVGDFVISLRSFQGGLEYSKHRGIVSPAYTVLKPIVEIDKSFYRYYFKSAEFIGHLAIAVIGIRDGKQISYEDFCFVKIPYPNIEEQKAISTVLLQADKEIEIQKQKLAAMQEQKKGLMQVLLTGKKRIK